MNQTNPKSLTAKALNDWLHDDSSKPFLIDVREAMELEIAPFPFQVVHLPLSEIASWKESFCELLPKNQSIVVICHGGIRSWDFGRWLLAQEVVLEVWNLQGGIDAWSREVDSNVPFY